LTCKPPGPAGFARNYRDFEKNRKGGGKTASCQLLRKVILVKRKEVKREETTSLSLFTSSRFTRITMHVRAMQD